MDVLTTEEIEAEAAKFETWAWSRHLNPIRKPKGDWGDHRYMFEHIESMWLGWKFRAELLRREEADAA